MQRAGAATREHAALAADARCMSAGLGADARGMSAGLKGVAGCRLSRTGVADTRPSGLPMLAPQRRARGQGGRVRTGACGRPDFALEGGGIHLAAA